MIKLDAISLQRGSKLLLENSSATLFPGQKAALIGANGSGKSSLFQLLLAQLSTDSGSVSIPPHWRIAYMAQEVAGCSQPALEYIIDGDTELRALQTAIAEAERNHDDKKLPLLYEQLDNIGGYNATVRAEQLMLGLGFSLSDRDKAAKQFSGGWRIRLNLAQALMCQSDLLLLDEPTNHLDLDAELWLEQWLQRYPGTLLLISHDRDFINNVCDHVIHLEHRQLHSYRGNYTAFEQQRAEKLAQQQASYEKQQRRIEEIQRFVSRFRAKASKAKQAQSRLKELTRMADIAPAHIDSAFTFSFPAPERFSDPLLTITQADIGYRDHIVASGVNLSIHPGTRIGLLGANGAGKSTLIKSLADELTLVAGTRIEGEHLQLGYFSQHQLEALDLNASPVLHLQRLSPNATEQSLRNFLGGFNFHGDMALEPIRHFSGGEKARLALAIVVWQKPNLLLLDEPTNHLDLDMCHALTLALQSYQGAVIVVSHDRHLLRNTVDQFILIRNGKADGFDGDLDDYSRLLSAKSAQPEGQEKQEKHKAGAANKKAQRKQSADIRKQLSPITKAIKTAEQDMEAIADELSQIENGLSDNSLYADDNKQQLQDLLRRQSQLKTQNTDLEEHWITLQDELEQLEKLINNQ